MPDAPAQAAPPIHPGPDTQDRSASRSGRLLTLVRKLIDYGKELIGTLQQPPSSSAVVDITYRFGIPDLAQIVARITRGLQLAAELAERIVKSARCLDRAAARRSPGTPPPSAPTGDGAAHAPDRLPTARQIAAQVRRRPIGEVIVDICRDLGIVASHPLWRDLHRAITRHGGNYPRLVREIVSSIRLTKFVPPNPLALEPQHARVLAAALGGTTGPP